MPGLRCSHFLLDYCSSFLNGLPCFPSPEHQWVSNSTPQRSWSDPSRGWVTSCHTSAPNSPHFIQIKSHHPPTPPKSSPSGLATPGIGQAHFHLSQCPWGPFVFTLFFQKSLWLTSTTPSGLHLSYTFSQWWSYLRLQYLLWLTHPYLIHSIFYLRS